MKIRLQVYLARSGVCSRRAGEKLIKQGKVRVNGRIVDKLGEGVDPKRDLVTVQDRQIRPEREQIYIFHKPRGVLTTMSDPGGRPSIADYIKTLPVRVFPVGRLDRDVSGLLLLTNDGIFGNQLLHPRYGVERVYWAIVQGAINEEVLKRLGAGIRRGTFNGKAKSARSLRSSSETKRLLREVRPGEALIEVVVTEGKKHFVKDLLFAAGLSVERLCRVRFGRYRLGKLQAGEIVAVQRLLPSLT